MQASTPLLTNQRDCIRVWMWPSCVHGGTQALGVNGAPQRENNSEERILRNAFSKQGGPGTGPRIQLERDPEKVQERELPALALQGSRPLNTAGAYCYFK